MFRRRRRRSFSARSCEGVREEEVKEQEQKKEEAEKEEVKKLDTRAMLDEKEVLVGERVTLAISVPVLCEERDASESWDGVKRAVMMVVMVVLEEAAVVVVVMTTTTIMTIILRTSHESRITSLLPSAMPCMESNSTSEASKSAGSEICGCGV